MKRFSPWTTGFAFAAILATTASVNVVYQWSNHHKVTGQRQLASEADKQKLTDSEQLAIARQELALIKTEIESVKAKQDAILERLKLQDDNSAEVTRLKGELAKLNTDLENAKSNLATKEQEFKAQSEQLKSENAKLLNEKADLDGRLISASADNKKLTEELDVLRPQLQANIQKVSELEQKKSQLESDLAKVSGDNTALKAELEKVNAELASEKSKVAALETQRNELLEKLKAADEALIAGKKENEKLLAEKADLLLQLEAAKASLVESNKRISTLEGELATTRQTLAQKETRLKESEVQLAASANKILDLETKQCENERSIRQLSSDVQTLVKDKQKVVDAALEQEKLMTKSLDEKQAALKKKDEDFKKKEEEFKAQNTQIQQAFAQSLGQMMMFFQMSQMSMQQQPFFSLSNPLNHGTQNDMLLMMLLMNNGRSSNGFGIPSYGYGMALPQQGYYNAPYYGFPSMTPDYGMQGMGGANHFPSYPRNGGNNGFNGGYAF